MENPWEQEMRIMDTLPRRTAYTSMFVFGIVIGAFLLFVFLLVLGLILSVT